MGIYLIFLRSSDISIILFLLILGFWPIKKIYLPDSGQEVYTIQEDKSYGSIEKQ